MITKFSQCGISIAYRVTKPSISPAAIVKGTVLRNIFNPSFNPILNEFNREKVRGKSMDAPKMKPQAASITIPKISIEP